MKKLFSKWLTRLRQPRWRHGKMGTLLMAAFLAICVLVNIGVKALEDEYGWKRDLSFNQYATTGAQTRAAVDSLVHDVELYLLYQNGAVDSQLLALLERYEVLSERISVKETDINRNPGILTRFEPDFNHAIEADTVIVHCPDTGRYRLLSYAEDFITQSYNVDTGEFELAGLAYEKCLTEAIVYVAQDMIPTVGVLSGHGELDEESLALLLDFFRSNNCDVRTVNMLAGDGLNGIDMLLIAAPQKDLSDAELEQISAFAKQGKSLFVMRDYIDPMENMPNYLSFLRSYGVIPLPGVAVAGEQDAGSYYEEPLYLVPYMTALDGIDILLMPASGAFEAPKEPDGSLTVGTVLKTGPHAYVRNLADGAEGIEKQPGDPEGEMSVALFAHRMHGNGNISRLFAIGCSATFTTEYIYQRSYVEEFLLMLIGEMLPEKTVSLDIMAAAAVRPGLTVGSKSAGIVIMAALPLVIILSALVVLLPRRSR